MPQFRYKVSIAHLKMPRSVVCFCVALSCCIKKKKKRKSCCGMQTAACSDFLEFSWAFFQAWKKETEMITHFKQLKVMFSCMLYICRIDIA